MSTQINVTIGDQRLLQANKARTAANQQNLDDRLLNKKTEEEAKDKVEEQQAKEEEPGAIPIVKTPIRPAAQRRLTLTYQIYAHTIYGDENTYEPKYVEPRWTAIIPYPSVTQPGRQLSALSKIGYNEYILATRKNNHYAYEINTKKQVTGRNVRVGTYNVYNVMHYMTWGNKVSSTYFFPAAQNTSVGPTFPLSSWNSAASFLYDLATSEQYFHISYMYYYYEHTPVEIAGAVGRGTGYDYPVIMPIAIYPGTSQGFGIGSGNSTLRYIGIYCKISRKTFEQTFRQETLFTRFVPGPVVAGYWPTDGVLHGAAPATLPRFSLDQKAVEEYVNSMDPESPRKQILTETQDFGLARDAVFDNIAYDSRTGFGAVLAYNALLEHFYVYTTDVLETKLPWSQVYAQGKHVYDEIVTSLQEPPVSITTPSGKAFKFAEKFKSAGFTGYNYSIGWADPKNVVPFGSS